MQEILAALALLKTLRDDIGRALEFIDEHQDEAWFKDSAAIFGKLRAAKTDAERAQIGKELRDLVTRLGA